MGRTKNVREIFPNGSGYIIKNNTQLNHITQLQRRMQDNEEISNSSRL
jgi:hypothetical protein